MGFLRGTGSTPYNMEMFVCLIKFKLNFILPKRKISCSKELIFKYMQTPASKCAIPEKNQIGWGKENNTFLKKILDILDLSFYSWKILRRHNFTFGYPFSQSCVASLEIPVRRTKTYGNSTWFFLDHCWKFHIFFNWPLEFLHALFLITWKFHVLKTRWIFYGIAKCRPEL